MLISIAKSSFSTAVVANPFGSFNLMMYQIHMLVILVLSIYFNVIVIIVETCRVQFTIQDWRCGVHTQNVKVDSKIRRFVGSAPRYRVPRGSALSRVQGA